MTLPAHVLKMRDLLLRAGLVDEMQLRSALARLEQWGGRLPAVLADLGMVDEEQAADEIAKALRMQRQQLGTVPRDAVALGKLDVAFCEEHAVFPVAYNAKTKVLTVAMSDPLQLDVIDLIASKTNSRVLAVVSPESQIKAAILRAYRHQSTPAIIRPNLARRAVTADIPAPTPMHPAPVVSSPGGASMELELDASVPLPVRGAELPSLLRRAPSANTLLDEMLGEEEKDHGFTEDELARIGNLRLTQQKTHAILKVLAELLHEKGYTR